MTDKQIIIDGVEVSGCDCYIKEQLFPNNLEGDYYTQKSLCECGVQGCESYPFFCKDNPNCYYKQLKRKEQECEELNKIFERAKKAFKLQFEDLKQAINEILQKISEVESE